jgi:hypothetical protein
MEFRLLKPDEIEVRISRINKGGVSCLLYKDARCDMRILDETIGADKWQRNHELINGNLFCNVGILTDNGWIWKQDVGTESYTEATKGEASDSFKRACFNWGIGRELYTAPDIFFPRSECEIVNDKCYDRFIVEKIEYKDKRIIGIKVKNLKTGSLFVSGTCDPKNKPIDKAKINIIKADISKGDTDEKKLLDWLEVGKIEEITEEKFRKYADAKKSKEEKK